MVDAPVLIAGGGPVGMTLALELARAGIRSILVERNADTTHHPKMNLTNCRSMELFRRLGLERRLRDVGVPENHCLDILRVSSLAGHLIHRIVNPSPAEHQARSRHINDGVTPLEPPMRTSQAIMEPVLREALEWNPLVDVRFGCTLESVSDNGDHIVATVRPSAGGASELISARFLAACDGGASTVRTQLGIAMEGDFAIARPYLVHFRSRDYEVLNRWGMFWHLQTPQGSLVAQDDKEIWTLNIIPPAEVKDSDLDPYEVVRSWAGCDFNFEVILANRWSAHLTVAERYRSGNILLAGDAAHQVVPTGGYGMNSGIADAVDLGWKLGAVLNGWAGEAILDSYEAERRPIALQNREASRRHLIARGGILGIFDEAAIDDEAPDAPEQWREVGGRLAALGNAENESWGVEFGYSYNASPIIAYNTDERAPFDPLRFMPTTFAGARLPNFYLKDGSRLFDRLGIGYTLIVRKADVQSDFSAAAAAMGVPLHVLCMEGENLPDWFDHACLLIRPDHHIAWRGDDLPNSPEELLRRVTGREAPASAIRDLEMENRA